MDVQADKSITSLLVEQLINVYSCKEPLNRPIMPHRYWHIITIRTTLGSAENTNQIAPVMHW